MAIIGYLFLLGAFFFGCTTIFLGASAGFGRKEELYRGARYGVFGVAALISGAAFSLLYSFATHDFTLRYVFLHSDSTMPTFYNMLALWGGQEGSLLFWAWILSVFSAIVVAQNRDRNRELMPHVIWVLQAIILFFTVLMVFTANPFQPFAEFDVAGAAMDLPLRGRGLNPQLQTVLMAIHPPMLYFGFIAWSVPFAFGVAALIARRTDADWTTTTRRWALLAWLFLLAGNLLGSYWAYTELGWGGFWAWDPVENAAFMPWLIGTAYLHSIQIQERRGMLKVWNLVLVTLAFVLTVFGTFLTRSGFVNSVHSFAKSDIGYYFLVFLGVVLLGAYGLIVARRDLLRSEGEIDSLASREFIYLVNNIVLLGAALAVLVGTVWPKLSELVLEKPITIAEPWFNSVMAPIGLLLLVLMGAGPLLPWRRSSKGTLRRQFVWPTLAAGAAMLLAALTWASFFPLSPTVACTLDAVCGPGRTCSGGACVRDINVGALLAISIVVFVVASIVQEFVRGAMIRMRNAGVGPADALGGLVARAPRRYGGYVIHVGFAMLFVAFTGQAFTQEFNASLKVGGTVDFAGYTVRLDRIESYRDTHRDGHIAHVSLLDRNQVVASFKPEDRVYNSPERPRRTMVDIHSTLGRDLYFVLSGVTPQAAPTKADIKIQYNPLVAFLWMGGVVMLFGTLLSMMPMKSRQSVSVKSRKAAVVTASLLVVAIMIGGAASARAQQPPEKSGPSHSATQAPGDSIDPHERDRVAPNGTRDPRAQKLDEGLMCGCNDCKFGKTLAKCGCSFAERQRERVAKWVAAGKADNVILGMMVGEFGDRVLAIPPATVANTAARVLPYVAIVLAGSLAAWIAVQWTRRRRRGEAGAEAQRSAAADARFDDELKKDER